MLQSRSTQARVTRRLAAAGSVALAVLGCGSDRSQGVMTADLERDLSMAESAVRPQTQVVSALEGGPMNAPSGTNQGRRDNVVRRQRAPMASPQATVTQEAPATTEVAESPAPAVPEPKAVVAQAPTPTPATEAPAPRPTWGVIYDEGQSSGRGPSDGRGTSSTGTGRDGGWGGGSGGVIIRGGGAGEDHCEIHDRRNGRRPGGMGTIGGMGGIIGGVIGGAIGRGTYPRY